MRNATVDKPSIVMLAAHEPRDDPRVDWAAQLAAKHFKVLVVGLRTRTEQPAGEDSRSVYRILRCERSNASMVRHLARYAVECLRQVRSRWCMALILILSPVVMITACVLEVAFRFVRLLIRLLMPVMPSLTLLAARRIATNLFRSRLRNGRRWSLSHKVLMYLWTWKHVLGTEHAFTSFLNQYDERVDVVYCHDLDSLLAGVLYRKRNSGVRVIYDSHEYWPHSNVEAMKFHLWSFTWYERFLIRRADEVLTVSDPLARELERVYRIDKVEVVPNAELWVESAGQRDVDSKVVAALSKGRVSFLFQGNFAPKRGLEELILAWKGIDSARAVLFLRGPDNASKQALRQLAYETGLLNEAVFFLDAIDVDDLVAGSAEADVGVIPYRSDLPGYKFACPNKLSQYLHAGVAVLSNDIVYVRSIVEAGDCGAVYDVNDAASIVRAVEEMAGSGTRLKQLKNNAKNYGQRVFNWQVQSRPLERILTNLAETCHRSG